MKSLDIASRHHALLVAGFIAMCPGLASAQAATTKPATRDPAPAVYKPPLRGAPVMRLSGGSRGAAVQTLQVLAPEGAALTASAQPALYWYTDEAVELRVVFTVTNARSRQTLTEAELPAPTAGGIHRIDLQALDVRFETGVEYEWFVAIVDGAEQSSKDIVAGATVERIAMPASLRSALARAETSERFAVLAGGGLWYESIDAISELVRQQPANTVLRSRRAALLAQVGLAEAADFDSAVR